MQYRTAWHWWTGCFSPAATRCPKGTPQLMERDGARNTTLTGHSSIPARRGPDIGTDQRR